MKPTDERSPIAAAILSYDGFATEQVEAFGTTVNVRAMTAGERDRFELAYLHAKETGQACDIRAMHVAFCVVDDEGKRVFGDDDVARLSGRPARELDKVFAVAKRLSGLDDQDVEELAGNSSPSRAAA